MLFTRPAVLFLTALMLALFAWLGYFYLTEAERVHREQIQHKEAAAADAAAAVKRHRQDVQRFWKDKEMLLQALQIAARMEPANLDTQWDSLQTQLRLFPKDERLAQLAREAREVLHDAGQLRQKIHTYEKRLATEPDLREVLQERLASFRQDLAKALPSIRPRCLSIATRVAELDPPALPARDPKAVVASQGSP
ncbi:hypothetical protein [Verrucomicrobium sp. BvORR034]|uniref:hypothetical protein n=1 Tax=Verrucomicrobium sp. BvORR034 TaxID=1396418 RepID=UPI00067990A5|nr:hypothetical protein [Verrucomicrobium sp. BvORR034]